MSAAPFMQLYVGDYLSDTLHLTTEQHGAYLLLLMTMWRADARLPNDPVKLARICRVTTKRWPSIWAEIEGFFEVDGEFITNNRLTKEHQKAVSISQKRRDAGEKGAEAKALKNHDTLQANADANDLPLLKHSQRSEIRDQNREPNGSLKKDEKKRVDKGARLSAEWSLPDEWFDDAVELGASPERIKREVDRFRDYWIAKPGKDGVKQDWRATWRNWMRRVVETSPQPRDDDAERRRRRLMGPQFGEIVR